MIDTIESTRICLGCGEEIDCGIMHTVRHDDVCKRNAPNENIESHKINIYWEEMDKVEKENFNPIFKRMTPGEQKELVMLCMAGIPAGDNVYMMGMESFQRIKKFKEQMKNKYLK